MRKTRMDRRSFLRAAACARRGNKEDEAQLAARSADLGPLFRAQALERNAFGLRSRPSRKLGHMVRPALGAVQAEPAM